MRLDRITGPLFIICCKTKTQHISISVKIDITLAHTKVSVEHPVGLVLQQLLEGASARVHYVVSQTVVLVHIVQLQTFQKYHFLLGRIAIGEFVYKVSALVGNSNAKSLKPRRCLFVVLRASLPPLYFSLCPASVFR
jgi:hypothetical protein